MIIDTTYLLPLARIKIETDLLRLIAEDKIRLKFSEIIVNLISIFELQAKATKLTIPPQHIIKATEVILRTFKIKPFHDPKIIEVSYELRKIIPDYIDCIITATAVTTNENLITEDTLILTKKHILEKEYNIKILSYDDIIKEGQTSPFRAGKRSDY
ncbi:MAG: PIN domain-containing protein [Thermoprotei archaeon]